MRIHLLLWQDHDNCCNTISQNENFECINEKNHATPINPYQTMLQSHQSHQSVRVWSHQKQWTNKECVCKSGEILSINVFNNHINQRNTGRNSFINEWANNDRCMYFNLWDQTRNIMDFTQSTKHHLSTIEFESMHCE